MEALRTSLLRSDPTETLRRASRHALIARVADGLARAEVDPSARALLLVSGGSDSMALLLAMATLTDRVGPAARSKLAVLSIDHGLREESAREVELVASTARALGVGSCVCERVEVKLDANVLAAARDARYSAAVRLAQRLEIRTLVVAHQAEDRAESLLLALERGDGLESLARLRPRRVMHDWGEVSIARPLLDISRADLRTFLTECNVDWIEDPSNAFHARGAMRGEPAVALLVERLARGIGNLADEARECLEWREQRVAEILGRDKTSCSREDFDKLPLSFRCHLIAQLVRSGGGEMSRSMIEMAASSNARAPRRYRCSNDVQLSIDARSVRIAR
ncbi:MAG: hypothetical protein RL591_563 [Planctomycetota bacterium]